jgi:prepilin-type N-terminal cleavage/methylation domain-containing protein
MKDLKRKPRAFTLIELLVVIAIIAIDTGWGRQHGARPVFLTS